MIASLRDNRIFLLAILFVVLVFFILGGAWMLNKQTVENADALTVQSAEYIVNTNTANHQAISAIDHDSNGNYVIAWQDFAQDGSSSGIYAQRYDNTGAQVGGEFLVNTTTVGDQSSTDVAVDSDGDFVIVSFC